MRHIHPTDKAKAKRVVMYLYAKIKMSLNDSENSLGKSWYVITSAFTPLMNVLSSEAHAMVKHPLWQKYVPLDINGWQLLLILQMLVLTPMMAVLLVNANLQQTLALRSSFTGFMFTVISLVTFLCTCGFSLWAGIELLRKREWPAVQLAARVLWAAGPLAIFLIQLILPLLVFGRLTDTLSFGTLVGYFISSLGLAFAWTGYFVNSASMRRVYQAPLMDAQMHVIDLEPDGIQRDSKPIVGNPVSFYLLVVFTLLLWGIFKYHDHLLTIESQGQPVIHKNPPLAAAKQQVVSQPSIETAQEPRLKVGDAFVVESVDMTHSENNHKTKRTVISVNPNGFDLAVVNLSSKSGKRRVLKFDKQWNLTATRNANHSGYNYSPPLKYFDFPLVPGKTWKQTSIETDIKTGAVRTHVIEGVVGAWETITIPAGTFRALKVSLQTILYDPKSTYKTQGTDVSWYSPEAKRSIKSETSLTDANGNSEQSKLLLIKFHLAEHD